MLILQATFVDEDRAAEFWLTAAGLMESWRPRPGSSAASTSPMDRTTR